MRMMVMIIYLLFLICMIVYYGKMMYRNYQKELPLGYGQNKIVYFMILLCIIIGQYTIPSAWGRLSVILIFGVAFFLIYAMIGLHNKIFCRPAQFVHQDIDHRRLQRGTKILLVLFDKIRFLL